MPSIRLCLETASYLTVKLSPWPRPTGAGLPKPRKLPIWSSAYLCCNTGYRTGFASFSTCNDNISFGNRSGSASYVGAPSLRRRRLGGGGRVALLLLGHEDLTRW